MINLGLKLQLSILFFLFYSFVVFAKDSQRVESIHNQFIIIKNTQSFDRQNEIITIDKKVLRNSNPKIFPIVKRKSQILISQLSDSDNDGRWDKLLVEINLHSFQQDSLQIEWVAKDKLPIFNNATNIRFSYKSKTSEPTPEIEKLMRLRGFTQDISNPVFQMEGPGIENDKVAFRIFFDKRNSKDLYGKLTSKMILDKVGLVGSWHHLADWGMDILHSGTSIGSGGLAVKEAGIVYPLADADSSFYNFVEEGPLKASFKLRFSNWDAGRQKINGQELISIQKGDYFFKEKVVVRLNKNQKLVDGMPNFFADTVVLKKLNKKYSSISTYSKQADGTKTYLGLAVMFPTKSFSKTGRMKTGDKLTDSFYVELNPTKNELQTIYYFACWEMSDKRFSTVIGFNEYLQNTANRLENPIKVQIK